MSDRLVALVTGANKGIGEATARGLAERGYVVLVGARHPGRGADAAERFGGIPLELDVADSASVERARERVEREYGRLDVLVNNAGVGPDLGVPFEETDDAGWEETFRVNVLGLVRVTRAFLPLLRRAPAGRIVNVSSILASVTLASDPHSLVAGWAGRGVAYDASKAAVNMVTAQLAADLRETPLKVNAAHPGYVRTDMTGGESGPAPLSPDQGARTSLRLATLDESGPTGGFFHLDEPLPW